MNAAELCPSHAAITAIGNRRCTRVAHECRASWSLPCSARVRAQILLVLTGEGANGKGIVLKVLEAMFGEYAAALPSRTLTAKSQEEHPAALIPLRGARVGLIDELPEGVMWAENIIKVLTGGGTITARWMNENPQSWAPTHTLILAANGHPLVPPGSKAFWRRYREIEFTQSFATTADEWASGGYVGMADEGMEERLLTELPGILNWALEGYQAYLVRGLDEPEAVLAAGRRARADGSSFATFADGMFTVHRRRRGPHPYPRPVVGVVDVPSQGDRARTLARTLSATCGRC